MDRFQTDPAVRVAVCNLIAGGIGITLTAAVHVIFQDLDWVPANHLQAEDCAYRLGQTEPATVEYLLAEGTLDRYVAALPEAKGRLIQAVETDELPAGSIPDGLYAKLRALAPALLQEGELATVGPDAAAKGPRRSLTSRSRAPHGGVQLSIHPRERAQAARAVRAGSKVPSAWKRSQASSTRRRVRYSPCSLNSFSSSTRKVSDGQSAPITSCGSRT